MAKRRFLTLQEGSLRKRLSIYLLLVLTSCFVLLSLWGSDAGRDRAAASRPPKLIVIIVIDQFRPDYLARFRPYFVERGFNLLLSGANFVNCRYDYAVTTTGPGHATLFTGAYPNVHGIIENDWYDRSMGRAANCVEDPDAKLVQTREGAGEQRGPSPRKLLGSTLGDELRLASDFRSKVIAIALKNRAAVLPGGHTANAAYWYQSGTARFVSSTYYMSALPAWVAKFNEDSPAKDYCGKAWQALPETPGGDGRVFRRFEPQLGAPCPDVNFMGWLDNTPFITDLELRFAREVIRNEHLGEDAATDLLAISLSVNDSIGHEFGPYSPEVADATLRTDRYLADFFADLDRMIGLDNVWIALSADHGVAPNARFVKEHRLGIGKFQGGIRNAVEKALSLAFGSEQWTESVGVPYIYLNPAALNRRQVPAEKAETEAARAAAAVPGVMAAFTRTQLLTGGAGLSPLGRKALNSFHSQRSGDVFLILEPYAVAVGNDAETTHGTPWNYDAQVPLLLWGSAFKPGVYAVPCQPIDLVATLAAALDLNQPSGAQGSPLTPALKGE
jgi:hypothetical protein